METKWTEDVQPEKEAQPTKPQDLLPGMEALPIVLLIVCAWLFVRGVVFAAPGISVLVAAAAFCGVAVWYMRRVTAQGARKGMGVLAFVLGMALSCALFEHAGAKWLLVLLAILSVPYWLLIAFGRQGEGDRYAAMPVDVARAAVEIPAQHWWVSVRGIGRRGGSKTAMWVLLGLLVSVPLLLVTTGLLMEADGAFRSLVEDLGERFMDDLRGIVVRGLLTVIVGWYLIALVYGMQNAGASKLRPERRWALPVPLSAVVLVLLSLLYGVFCVVQTQSVARVFAVQPRIGFSYSEYAREGFFELCAIVVINLCVYLAVQGFTAVKPVLLRVLLTLLGVLTLALILIAGLKMGLYMQRYGLTLLRVYTMGFMALLFIVFCFLIAAQWKRFALMKGVVLACVVSALALGFSNVPGQVARLNVDRYLAGSLSSFDMDQYRTFPYAAAPHLIRLYEQTDEAGLRAMIRTQMYRVELMEDEVPAYGKTIQRLVSEGEVRAFMRDTAARDD